MKKKRSDNLTDKHKKCKFAVLHNIYKKYAS